MMGTQVMAQMQGRQHEARGFLAGAGTHSRPQGCSNTATIQVFSRELTGDKVSIWHLSLLHVISHFPRPQDDTSSVNIYLKPFLKRIFKFGSGIQGLSLVYP